MMYCAECGIQNPDEAQVCVQCDSPLEGGTLSRGEQAQSIETTREAALHTHRLRKLKTATSIIAAICYIVALVFFIKGYDVKHHYNNSDYSFLSKNAYVGGDAYNYIINGTYFTSYSTIASASLICGTILVNSAISIATRIHADKE